MKNKKILLVMPINKSTVLRGISRALSFIGWDYHIFDYRNFNLSEKFLTLSGNDKLAIQSMNRRLVESVNTWKPRLIFVIKGSVILPETLKAIEKQGVLTINWFPEDFRFYDLSKTISRHYNIFLYAESSLIPYLKKETGKKDVYHLPFGADILPGDPPPPVLPKEYNLTVIGTAYPVRVDLLPTVSDLGLDIWGDETWSKTNLSKYWHGSLPYEKIFEVYGKSKIAINMDFSPIGNSVLNRAYEIMSTGSFCLARSRSELGKYFKLDKEIVSFNTDKELRDKAKYYLLHNKEREKIAQNGYQAVRARHTYIQRFTKLFKELGIE